MSTSSPFTRANYTSARAQSQGIERDLRLGVHVPGIGLELDHV